jgi:hypothetical protein
LVVALRAETGTAPLSLTAVARVFFTQRSPQIIVAVFAATVAARLVVARWSWWDLLAPAILIAVQPFTEWNIHVFLLHFKPVRLGGRTIDPLVARKHRAHHGDPKDLGLVFIPLPALVPLIAAMAVGFLLFLPLSRGLSLLVGGYAMLFTYEWTHYLIHTAYRPRHRVYRYIWRAHRNHHFRNEHYWFGVTMHLADHVLRTFPEKTAVEVSPTARTLGIDPA